IEGVEVDHIVPVERMAAVLERVVAEPIPPDELPPVREEMLMEIDIAGRAESAKAFGKLGRPSLLGCPECGGPLNLIYDGEFERYRCHVGHAWSPESLSGIQSTRVEDALWTAVRWLEEEEALSRHGAERARRRGNERVAQFFDDRVRRA